MIGHKRTAPEASLTSHSKFVFTLRRAFPLLPAWTSSDMLGLTMLTDQFRTDRARMVRDLASKADPHIKKRLLQLAARYEQPEHREGLTPVDLQYASQIPHASGR